MDNQDPTASPSPTTENIPVQTSPVLPESSPPPKKFSLSPKIILIILALLIIVVIGSGLYLSVGSQPKQVAKSTPTPLPTEASAKAVTPTPDPTASWKTYTNQKYKFSFKYPQNFFQAVDYGEFNLYQLRFSTCEFKKKNGAQVELEPSCPVFNLALLIGIATTSQYALAEKTAVGNSSIDKSHSQTGIITYKRQADLNTSSGRWLRYDVEREGKFDPKYSYNLDLRIVNNQYMFSVSSNDRTVVENNKNLTDQILSTFQFSN